MSINSLFRPNGYSLYSEISNIGQLAIVGDSSESDLVITSQQLYDSVTEVSVGVPNSLSGFNNAGEYSNITVGSGLSLSGNVLTSTSSGSGNVSGTISPASIPNTPAIYKDNTGLLIGSSSSLNTTNNTLLGYNGTNLSNITAGTNININSGVISAVGVGTGDVSWIGGTAIPGTPAIYDNSTGLIISQPAVNTTANTIIGYGADSKMTNIIAGTNVSISGGVISASAPAGAGDVTGPSSALTGSLTIFSDTTGKNISQPVFTPLNNSLLGYNTSSSVSNISVGTGLSLSSGILSSTSSGSGDVSGPISSIANTPAIYADSTGKSLTTSSIAVTNNTMLGYNGSALTNISAGNGISINNGLISTISSNYIYARYYYQSGVPVVYTVGIGGRMICETIDFNTGVYLNSSKYYQVNVSGVYVITAIFDSRLVNPTPSAVTYLNAVKNGSAIVPYNYSSGAQNFFFNYTIMMQLTTIDTFYFFIVNDGQTVNSYSCSATFQQIA